MHNLRAQLPFSLLSLVSGAVGILFVTYVGIIAVVMSYAALTVEFSQSVKNDEAAVAVLESQYLASVAHITNMNYAAEGYAPPLTKIFVRAQSGTALR